MNGLIQEVKLKEKNPFSFFKTNYINKNDRTSHWVGKLCLKELDTNDLSVIKQIIEEIEAGLTEASETNLKTDNLAVTEEANVDESITAESKASNKMEIDLQKEHITKSYKKQWTLILKILTHLKSETKYIQLNGGQSTKL